MFGVVDLKGCKIKSHIYYETYAVELLVTLSNLERVQIAELPGFLCAQSRFQKHFDENEQRSPLCEDNWR